MVWQVIFHSEFLPEFDNLDDPVKLEILALAKVLAQLGPGLKRPQADTLNKSKFYNMKELRFKLETGGLWRVAYALDPKKQAILLVAGDKAGVSQQMFYDKLIKKADRRYRSHLNKLKEGKNG